LWWSPLATPFRPPSYHYPSNKERLQAKENLRISPIPLYGVFVTPATPGEWFEAGVMNTGMGSRKEGGNDMVVKVIMTVVIKQSQMTRLVG